MSIILNYRLMAFFAAFMMIKRAACLSLSSAITSELLGCWYEISLGTTYSENALIHVENKRIQRIAN